VIEHAAGVMHVRNAASPAATSSLAIAGYIAEEAGRRFDLPQGAASLTPGAGFPAPRAARGDAMQTFVEADWLLAHLADPGLRIVDARSTPHGAPGVVMPSGAEQYAAGHLPGAIQLDYADQLADPATPYAARVAPPDLFARMLGERGIGDPHTIVAYDDGTVPYAARFVWMCRYYGHDGVHVLAGGLPAWVAAGGALTREVPAFPAAGFTPRERAALRASREEVLAVAGGQESTQLLETQRDPTYALRDRDIAGAKRLSGSLLLEDARGGRIAERATIDALVESLGLDRSKRTIVSCGSGVSASGAYLALVENGFSDVAVYDGSWMEWSHHGLPTVPKGKPC
jgi:thiosulfate/3-mercaptopyruvate sulfurtransferase